MRKLSEYNGHKNIHWWHTSLIINNIEDVYHHAVMCLNNWEQRKITKETAAQSIFAYLQMYGNEWLKGTNYHYVKGACKKWLDDNAGTWMLQ